MDLAPTCSVNVAGRHYCLPALLLSQKASLICIGCQVLSACETCIIREETDGRAEENGVTSVPLSLAAGGSAAVLGAARALADLQPEGVEV